MEHKNYRYFWDVSGTGSRRHTPYMCEYSGVPLRDQSLRQDRHDLEVGFELIFIDHVLSERHKLSVYKRYVAKIVPLPHY